MINTLTKNTQIISYTPPKYTVVTPGYSYKANTTHVATINATGITYCINYLKARGWNALPSNTVISSVYYSGSYWFAVIAPLPITKNSQGIWQYLTPPNIQLQISHVTILTTNSYVNVPEKKEVITPLPITKEVPIIGWNGGANSSKGFKHLGETSFSINPTSVGVFIGLCNKVNAVLDSHYSNITYAFYAHLGYYKIYIHGLDIGIPSTIFDINTIFKITNEDTRIVFYVNDVKIYSVDKGTDTIEYVLDCSLYYSKDEVIDASITSTTSYANLISEYNYVSTGISVGNTDLFIDYNYETNFNPFNGINSYYQYSLYFCELINQYSYTSYCTNLGYIGLEVDYGYESNCSCDGLVPSIPPTLLCDYFYLSYSRPNYIYPPKMFIVD